MNEKYDDERDFRVKPSEDGKSAVITKYTGKKQTVIIPPHLHGLPVTRIEEEVFKGKEIIRVTIPDSVTSIGVRAFADNFLISVTISEGVTADIGCAFDGCTSLTSITIPSSVTDIGYHAFNSCNNLKSVKVSRRTTIGNGAFRSETRIIYSD